MLFHQLPRFSVDLDFNLLDASKESIVFERVLSILKKYGIIKDEAKKYYGIVIVLDYGQGGRNLKVEISKRESTDKYEHRNFLGIQMLVMQLPYMLSHKLCAILDRHMLTNRDIFDCYYLLNHRTPIVETIIEERMGVTLATYLDMCIGAIERINNNHILSGMGELMDNKTKQFVKRDLKNEVIKLLKLYKEFPITVLTNQ